MDRLPLVLAPYDASFLGTGGLKDRNGSTLLSAKLPTTSKSSSFLPRRIILTAIPLTKWRLPPRQAGVTKAIMKSGCRKRTIGSIAMYTKPRTA